VEHKLSKTMLNAAHTSTIGHIEDDFEEWNEMFYGIDMNGGAALLNLADSMEFSVGGKGKGKNHGDARITSVFGKGPVKGKGKGKPDPNALPAPPADPLLQAVSKAKAADTLIDKTDLCLNQDLAALQKSQYFTPKLKATFNGHLLVLGKAKARLRTAILKVTKDKVEALKQIIQDSVAVVKEAQSFMKEHKGISSAASQIGE
jgi:hypothetical protein